MATVPERGIAGDPRATLIEGFSKQRVELAQRASAQWVSALRDLTARNNLLRYRDLKSGTLDLGDARESTVGALLAGKTVRLSSLFGEEGIDGARRRARNVHAKARENLEERGVRTLSLACGMGSWENNRAAWEPYAPVLVQNAELKPLGAALDEFELKLTEEIELNPTLAHLLRSDFDCDLDISEVLDSFDGAVRSTADLQRVYETVSAQTARVPGFRIDPRLVLANFAYTKLPMVSDLEGAFDELVAHELIAALAGDAEAIEALRAIAAGSGEVPKPDDVPYKDEFLVLDADCSQTYAINAVLGGQNLVIKGPPGTGKSQTIANMIATLIARGKRVLFVTEKRAAIDAVLKRLQARQLEELVLDVHAGVSSRKAFVAAVGKALNATRTVPPVPERGDLDVLEKRRAELNGHAAALHEPRMPWQVSVYEARSTLVALADADSSIRFSGQALAGLGAEARDAVVEQLRELARLGGIGLGQSSNPWAAARLKSDGEAKAAYETVERARRETLPRTLSSLRDAAAETGVRPAETIDGWSAVVDVWRETASLLASYQPEVFDGDLPALASALSPAGEGGFTRMRASLFSSSYKAARTELRGLLVQGADRSDADLRRDCATIEALRARWSAIGGTGRPNAPAKLEKLLQLVSELGEQLGDIEKATGRQGLATMESDQLAAYMDGLLFEQQTLMSIPRVIAIEAELTERGLAELLGTLHEQNASEREAVRAFEWCWHRSILDRVSIEDPRVGGFSAERHDQTLADFKHGDRRHIETTSQRIQRLCAEAAVAAEDTHRDQEQLIRRQVALKRKHLPVRELIAQAPDVLLALKPCWAMSPLLVSQLLPAKTLFDVVVFDEASQVTPADAIPSILRGKQLVVAGDEHQLPPTAFFASDGTSDGEDEDEEVAYASTGTADMESILDALNALLPSRTLQWHYRSKDEQLIAFSNAAIYDRMLTTFPGVGDTEVLRHVPVAWQPGSETNSPTPEVDRVVDLIFQHAEQRPEESLGVIAMGIKHANRIEETRVRRLQENPQLAERLSGFFDETREERFFIKNLERVQGDERDAIILSIGYGKNQRGEMQYRFGPLLSDGGQRRLNVAITRAKRRLTLVSSFSAADLDPERTNAAGVRLLRSYAQYVESDGRSLGEIIKEKPALNPFEIDVRDTLERHGLRLTAQLGTSGYWIDYAVHDPRRPGAFLLAIECDGATYHSSESARDRDRLRQEQLERLGWRFCRIWSADWFHDKQRTIEKVLAAYQSALNGEAVGVGEPRVEQPHSDGSRAAARAAERLQTALSPTDGPRRRAPRPNVRAGRPIGEYSPTELVAIVKWIRSDGLLRTEDELLSAAMEELGFSRRGKKIVDALEQAVKSARR